MWMFRVKAVSSNMTSPQQYMWCKDVLEQLNNAILMSKGFFNLLKEVYVQLLYNSF